MQRLARITRNRMVAVMGLALLAAVISGTSITRALDQNQTHNFTIKIYEGDPAQNKVVPGIKALLVADDRSNPSHGLSGISDSRGEIHFTKVHEGSFNVEIAHNLTTYNSRNYRVIIDADTVLEASITPKAVKTFNLTVKVYNGDPAQNKVLSGINVKTFADNSGSPTKDRVATTNSSGVANFALAGGGYKVHIGDGNTNFYTRDYHVIMDANTVLEASLISQTPPTNPNPNPSECLPTPPRGKPLLNIWPISESGAPCTDFSLLAAKNLTTGGAYVTGNRTVSATTGQIVQVSLYVHNGVLDYPEDTAHNVRVKATVPGSSGTMTAEAWADNAERIFSSQKGGNVNISLGSNQHLEYISGSTKLYDTAGAFQNNLPDGVVSSGVSIGDMRGCFPFRHFVTFQLKVVSTTTPTPTPTPKPTLTIAKTVSNVTNNTGFHKNVDVKTGDIVSFKLVVSNTGKGDATHVVAKDVLPTGLTNLDNVNLSNIALGTIEAGTSKTFTFRAKVTNIDCGKVLTNTATAQSNETGPVSDTATVSAADCPPPTTTITLSKTINAGAGFAKSVSVNAGSTMNVRLIVTNTGKITANNVVVTDNLPANLPFAGNLKVDGVSTTGSLSGLKIGNIAPGKSVTITFDVTTNNCDLTVTNISEAVASNAPKVTDSAKVTIICKVVTNAHLTISKTVKNQTTNTGFADSVNASFGDSLLYRLVITNTGNAAAQNLKIWDVLPSGIDYNDNLAVSLSATGSPVVSPFLKISSLSAGQSVTVTFAAKDHNTNCSTTLVNTGFASADNAAQVSDTANVVTPNCPNPIPQNPNIVTQKIAWNDTQNKDATTVTAKPGDEITFIIRATNIGDGDAVNFVFSDNVVDVLTLADIFDKANATLVNSVLTYPAVTIPAHSTMQRAFRVKIKNPLPTGTDCNITNTFGNSTVNIKVSCNPPFVAPPTGTAGTISLMLSLLTVAGFASYRTGKLAQAARLIGLLKS